METRGRGRRARRSLLAMLPRLPALVVVWATLALAQTPAEPVAVLQGLDKVTARISNFEVPVGETVRFGSLEITARHCTKRPPEEPPETTAFLEIRDIKPDEDPVKLFTGWMFASSPALSALEHPVYDVWVIDCRTSAPDVSSDKE